MCAGHHRDSEEEGEAVENRCWGLTGPDWVGLARRLNLTPRQTGQAVPGPGVSKLRSSSERQIPKIPSKDTLLKYDNPIVVGTTQVWKPPAARLKLSSLQPGSVPPAPKQKAQISPEAIKQQTEEILNAILPPREWKEGNKMWLQQVSTRPCTRTDVVNLENQLKLKLQEKQARHTGICPVRRELYSQCFDELIRQVAVNCAERGLLLSRVREEIHMSIGIYHALYESSVGYGMRTALLAEKLRGDMEKRVFDLEKEKDELKTQLADERVKAEKTRKRNIEKRENERQKHTDDIEALKSANLQYKAQLEELLVKFE
ncbi:axonemal dynein light intermediate polypeptide 1-like [Genypterus blacodes]|uniref:axonemal dynein light intermediate polypeptide 1-like n=1 Tax=Genypterus blacodes TaxID=154954 RepID=UPI003F77241F